MHRSASAAPGLADRLWSATRTLHREAERSGVIGDLLRGHATLGGYALFLRNLIPVYAALERGLEALAPASPVKNLARREVFRSAALQSDLERLGGTGLPVLAGAERYAERIEAVASGTGLIAHAYVRYLGDLNGGQILSRLLSRTLGLDADALRFYVFAGDATAHAERYREAIDAAAPIEDAEAIAGEAALAFALTIALSEEVRHRA